MTREIGYLAANSDNFIDTTWIRQGYHNEPDKLREILQSNIDEVEKGDDPFSCNKEMGNFDAILICYGLCSNGTAGLKSTKYPLVIPRAHDCITMLLGSKERYRTIFDERSGGIFWYSVGWVENSLMPSKSREELTIKEYSEQYGEENAEYLLEMESGWMKEYNAAAFIEHDEIKSTTAKELTKDSANYYKWDYMEFKGDLSLLNDFVNGNWDEERFLILPPNQSISPSFDNNIVKASESATTLVAQKD